VLFANVVSLPKFERLAGDEPDFAHCRLVLLAHQLNFTISNDFKSLMDKKKCTQHRRPEWASCLRRSVVQFLSAKGFGNGNRDLCEVVHEKSLQRFRWGLLVARARYASERKT